MGNSESKSEDDDEEGLEADEEREVFNFDADEMEELTEAPITSSSQIKSLLDLTSSLARRRMLVQLDSSLHKVIAISVQELSDLKELSVPRYPHELYCAVHGSISTNNPDILKLVGLLLHVLRPRSLNSSFGFSESHISELNRIHEKKMNDDRLSPSEKKFYYGCFPFHIVSTRLDESVLDNLSYLLLDKDRNLVELAVGILVGVLLHPMNRMLSHEPQGLILLCQDSNRVIQYSAICALGNLCLAANEKLGSSNNFTSSIAQIMRDGVVELVGVLLDEKSPFFVMEAAVRSLIMYAGNNKSRVQIAHLGVAFGNTKCVVKHLVGSSESLEVYTNGKHPRSPALLLFFYLLRLDIEDGFGDLRFHHLDEASRKSDLLYELSCILMSELAVPSENQHLFQLPLEFYGKDRVYMSDRKLYQTLFELFSRQSYYKPSSVALAMGVLNVCQTRGRLKEFVSLFDGSTALAAPLMQLFSRESRAGFDDVWSNFDSHSSNLRNQDLPTSIATNLLRSAEFEKLLEGLPRESTSSDVGFNELWVSFYQLSLCELLEKYIREDRPLPYLYHELIAYMLETCSDARVFCSLVESINVLAVKKETTARFLFEHGAISSLIKVLWLAAEDQGLLVVDILITDDPKADLFPPQTHHRNKEEVKTARQRQSDTFLSPNERTEAEIVGNQITVTEDSLLRVRKIIREVGITVTLLVLRAVTSFTTHPSLRETIGGECRLRGILYRILSLLHSNEPSDSTADARIAYPQIFPPEIIGNIRKQLIIGAANLTPVNNVLTKSNWVDPESLGLLRSLVEMTFKSNEGHVRAKLSRFVRYKALCGLANITRSRGTRLVLLSFTNLLPAIGSMLMQGSAERIIDETEDMEMLERLISMKILRNLTSRPDGMRLWLKLESRARMCIDSAGVLLPVLGKSFRQHALAGLGLKSIHHSPDVSEPWKAYRSLCSPFETDKKINFLKAGCLAYFAQLNHGTHSKIRASGKDSIVHSNSTEAWGVTFSGDDFIVLDQQGVHLGSEWTISFWTLINFADTTQISNHQQEAFTLTQSSEGDCQIAVIRRAIGSGEDEFLYELGSFVAKTKTWYGSGIDLYQLVPGWHHITVVGTAGKTLFYIDGGTKERNVTSIDHQCTSNILVVGNSLRKDQPWGTVADFRVYPYTVPRDSNDWDMFQDGRTWGILSYPTVDYYPAPTHDVKVHPHLLPNRVEDDAITSLNALPWDARPPDYIRYSVATFEDGALLQFLLEEFSSGVSSAEQELSTLILGDLCLCTQLRNKVLAMDAHSFFVEYLGKRFATRDSYMMPKIPKPTDSSTTDPEAEEVVIKEIKRIQRVKNIEQALCRLLYHDC